MSKIICGIDLGTKKTGFCCLKSDKSIYKLVLFESQNSNSSKRILEIAYKIKQELSKKISVVYVETPIYIQNFYTSSLLDRLFGMCELICSDIGIEFNSVSNKKWKKEVLGNGGASKEDIMLFSKTYWAKENFLSQDMCDAACIALYGLNEKKK